MGTLTGLRPLTPAESAAADMYAQGQDPAIIADQTGLSAAQVAAAVDLREQLLKEAAAPSAPRATAAPPRPLAPPRPTPSAATPKPRVVLEPDTLEELIAWAEKQGGRAATLGARISALGTDLRLLYRRLEEENEARAEVARLSQELEAAKSRLRTALGAPAETRLPTTSTAAEKALRARMREWARDNGYEVGAVGKLPAHIVAAYEAANPE